MQYANSYQECADTEWERALELEERATSHDVVVDAVDCDFKGVNEIIAGLVEHGVPREGSRWFDELIERLEALREALVLDYEEIQRRDAA